MVKPSLLQPINDWIAKHYANSPGKMLIHTGVVGWIMSSAAQIFAIGINDKIPNKQKMFLIPQEIADAAVNIISFYAITQTCKSLASTLVRTGKLIPKCVASELKAKNLLDKCGDLGFDVLKNADLSADVAKKFKAFSNGIDFSATTLGAILSCNIVTPLARNYIAAKRQQASIAKLDAAENVPAKVTEKPFFARPTMVDFQGARFSTYGSGSGLKI